MSKLSWYVPNWNAITTDLRQKVAQQLAAPRDAQIWAVWQDAQGSFRDLIKAAKELDLGKRIYCLQHGRGATRDYDKPNCFPFQSDKYLCWGQYDYDRLCSLGFKDRAAIVGCPLNVHIQPRIPHKEKVVLFVPVNTGKEEPENIATYYELLRIKYKNAQKVLLDNRVALKHKWENVKFSDLTQGFDVVAKLLPHHAKELYHGQTVLGYQDTIKNNNLLFWMLRNVDCVVGLDEGTTEAFAIAHDVPVIIVDGFKYHQHPDGVTPVEIEPYETKAAMHVKLENLEEALQFTLAHPEHLRAERAEVAEGELGLSYGDATENIFKLVREDMKNAL